ncbi:MAG: PilZ domain-containing protein [Candidatus Omnitrophica bacterium]|nr:PilZ domain-containing protein [Candidatus Omnitrophota bacterium]MDD5610387.1 PilZ domain-containing protein [Candidatus Omnitrophota bacterium]
MTKPITREKRKHPRVEKDLPLSICLKDVDFSTATKNISGGGAYCHVDKYIRPMTKLSVLIGLSGTKEEISCKGVVVRTENAVPTGYNIAIFFNEISKRNADRLKHYIQQHISYL